MSKVIEHLNSLNKVELSELVELKSLQEVDKLMGIALKLKDKSFDVTKKIQAVISLSISELNQTKNAFALAEKAALNVQTSIKGLGVPVPKQITDALQSSSIKRGDAETMIKKLQSIKL